MKLKLLIVAMLLIISTGFADAAESTTSAQASPSSDLKINELKAKLASRVAELSLVSQKLISGKIKTLSDEKIIIENVNGEINLNLKDDTDFLEILKDYTTKSIKLDNLKTGDNIYTWGLLNTSTNSLNTKSVVYLNATEMITGRIKSVDDENYQLSVVSNGKDVLIDHLITTKDYFLDKNNKTVRGGFSKFRENQLVYAVGTYEEDKNKNKLFSAIRLIILSEGKSSSPTSTPTPTVTKK